MIATGLGRELRDGAGAIQEPLEHIQQSVEDILTTPRGTRVMRPEYGSGIWGLVDRPVSPEWLVDVYAEVVTSLDRWEPRIRVTQVTARQVAAGQVTVDIHAVIRATGESTTLPVTITR